MKSKKLIDYMCKTCGEIMVHTHIDFLINPCPNCGTKMEESNYKIIKDLNSSKVTILSLKLRADYEAKKTTGMIDIPIKTDPNMPADKIKFGDTVITNISSDQEMKTVVRLYLQKLEKLNKREREVLIESIHLFNNPVITAKPIPRQ